MNSYQPQPSQLPSRPEATRIRLSDTRLSADVTDFLDEAGWDAHEAEPGLIEITIGATSNNRDLAARELVNVLSALGMLYPDLDVRVDQPSATATR